MEPLLNFPQSIAFQVGLTTECPALGSEKATGSMDRPVLMMHENHGTQKGPSNYFRFILSEKFKILSEGSSIVFQYFSKKLSNSLTFSVICRNITDKRVHVIRKEIFLHHLLMRVSRFPYNPTVRVSQWVGFERLLGVSWQKWVSKLLVWVSL
jgi:hypothetical protein